MKDNNISYCDRVVDMIMNHYVKFGAILKLNNGGKEYQYYLTTIFNTSFHNPLTFFIGINWEHLIVQEIKNRYGVYKDSDLIYIKALLLERFEQEPYVVGYKSKRHSIGMR